MPQRRTPFVNLDVPGADAPLGWSAAEAAAFLTTMRNIVDLNSRAPPSRGRVATVRPIDFLESVEGKIHVSHPAASKVA